MTNFSSILSLPTEFRKMSLVTLVSDSDKTVVRLLMDYYLEIKANSDTFKTKSLIIYSGNESQCSSEGKTTTIEDHITLILRFLWILRNTTSHLTFKQSTRLNKTKYLQDK